MILKLTEAQFIWVIGDTGHSEEVIAMLRSHFVDGIPRTHAAASHGFTNGFAAKKYMRFEEILREKCEKHGVEITTILHVAEDKNAVLSYDVPSGKKKER